MDNSQIKKTITVAIISYEREMILRKAIKSITEQTKLPDEILVIDSSRNPYNPDTLIDKSFGYLLKYIYIKDRQIIPMARNIALKEVTNDIISYIDDDAIPKPKFVETIVNSFEKDSKLGCIGGPTIITNEDLIPLEEIIQDNKKHIKIFPWGEVRSSASRWIPSREIEVDALQGANMSFPVNLLKSIGGFDGNYKLPSFREETDACLRIQRQGYQCIYHPDVFVYHIPNLKGGITDFESNQSKYFKLAGQNHRYFSDKFFPKWLSRLSWVFWSRNPPSLLYIIYVKIRFNKNFLAWHKGLWRKLN